MVKLSSVSMDFQKLGGEQHLLERVFCLHMESLQKIRASDTAKSKQEMGRVSRKPCLTPVRRDGYRKADG